MNSRKQGRKGQQQTLAFEPVDPTTIAAPSSSSSGLSPARIKLSSADHVQSSSPSKGPKALKLRKPGNAKKSERQSTLETSLGNATFTAPPMKHKKADAGGGDDQQPVAAMGRNFQARQRPAAPLSSFMRKSQTSNRRVVVLSDSDDDTSAEEGSGTVLGRDSRGPPKQEPFRPSAPPKRVFVADDNSANDSDSDMSLLSSKRNESKRTRDDDIQTPAKRRRLAKATATTPVSTQDDDDDDEQSSDDALNKPRRRLRSNRRISSPAYSASESTRPKTRKAHRSEKDKKRELLRRRKAGEKDLTIEDLTPTEDDEDDGGLYDTDSEHQALQVFDDESESEKADEAIAKPDKKSKKSKRKIMAESANQSFVEAANGVLEEDADSEDEAFIDDADDTIGVPDDALHLMPLEFTRASRKPLKAHFRDAIEWLIHRKINPAFERDNEVYTTAWRRLNDEVTGMAYSKFFSGAWRPDFMKALRARPYIEQVELGPSSLAIEFSNCQACGRSGHPASWSITFRGKPYDLKTLDEVESDSDEEDEDFDRDFDGNPIPPEDKEYPVGATCNIMAETAHGLLHWKVGLRDWTEDRLRIEHWLDADKVLQREKMKAKKCSKLADRIVQNWEEQGIIKNLFVEFKKNMEDARNLDMAKVSRHRRR
ncbi:hypothetical protein BD289DRAFT_423037 [Coniella lustricola]|uniref:DUF4211 domain-containing protein n=1 Tax=Coniella lustricola TaxID=2025994 RepID=A0A2T3AK48_9PEZI|nr:hypothetical protein BD289DRAFT_423037 [Coniella lustricola]